MLEGAPEHSHSPATNVYLQNQDSYTVLLRYARGCGGWTGLACNGPCEPSKGLATGRPAAPAAHALQEGAPGAFMPCRSAGAAGRSRRPLHAGGAGGAAGRRPGARQAAYGGSRSGGQPDLTCGPVVVDSFHHRWLTTRPFMHGMPSPAANRPSGALAGLAGSDGVAARHALWTRPEAPGAAGGRGGRP